MNSNGAGEGDYVVPGDTIGVVLGINPPDPRETRLADLERHRPTLIAYLKMKLEAEDWHGVQDAASDLRDVDSELDGLRY